MNTDSDKQPPQVSAPLGTTDILIVDDNADIRLLVRTMVGAGLKIAEASSGQEAWDMVLQLRPRLVLLDVMMPGTLNGLQVLSAIRQSTETSATKVVVVTGRAGPEDLRNARRHEADGYLTKPFSVQDIQSLVQTFLR